MSKKQDQLRRERTALASERLQGYELDDESEIFGFKDTLMAIPRGVKGFRAPW